jgi:anti-sigma factor (TIGR02949 family)
MTRPSTRRQHCYDLLGQLSDYLDGELSPARCRAIERHLDDCPCCGEIADSLRRAVSLCRQAGASRLPPAVRARARRRIADLLGSAPPPAARSQARRAG